MKGEDDVLYSCYKCGNELEVKDFYSSNSNIYCATGHLPICKDCLNTLFKIYAAQFGSKRTAMKRICMSFDLYYSDSIFDQAENATNKKNPFLSRYIQKLNMKQNKGKTFDSSIEEGFSFNDNKDEKSSVSETIKQRFGPGFENDQYRILDQHYKYLKKNNPNCDSNQEIFIQDLCFLHMQKAEAIKSGDKKGCIDLMTAYRNTFDKAGLKTVESIDDDVCLGKFVNLIGSHTPEYIYKDKELYKDADWIDEYIERLMVRPYENIKNKTNIRDPEYCIRDSEEGSVNDE